MHVNHFFHIIFQNIKQWLVECYSNDSQELDEIQKIFEDNGFQTK